MNYYDKAICQRIKTLIAESECYINLLYAIPCVFTRNLLLSQLNTKMNEIDFLSGIFCCQADHTKINSTELQQQTQQYQSGITRQELARFTGKDGSPAYVAVNGLVYDVTNSAAWAAASHFGLTAGKDLTSEFASCHAGQPILSKLKVVGKLI